MMSDAEVAACLERERRIACGQAPAHDDFLELHRAIEAILCRKLWGCVDMLVAALWHPYGGHGVYECVYDVMEVAGKEVVVPALAKGLCSDNCEVRSYSADMCRYAPDPMFVSRLEHIVLNDVGTGPGYAVGSLAMIDRQKALDLARCRLAGECDGETRSGICGSLLDLSGGEQDQAQ